MSNNPSKSKNILYQVSAILILLGAAGNFFRPEFKYVLLLGIAGLGSVVFTTRYPGKSIRGKRLYNMQIFAVILMVVSAFLLFSGQSYWILALTVAAILLLYSAFVLPTELKKEQDNGTEKTD